DRGVRAAAGLDAGDAIRRQRSRTHQEFGVPFGVDVVCDRRDVVALAHRLAEQVHQRGLARTNGTTDADSKRAVGIFHATYSIFHRPRLVRGLRTGRRDPYALSFVFGEDVNVL